MKRLFWFASLGIALLAFGFIIYLNNTPSQPLIRIEEAWARARTLDTTPMSSMDHGMETSTHSHETSANPTTTSAVYMVIRNLGHTPDYLVEVVTDVANRVEIHQTVTSGDVMQMQPINRLEIPAQSTVRLAPGGYHIMLIGLNRTLNPGDSIRLKLRFEQSGEIEITAAVR